MRMLCPTCGRVVTGSRCTHCHRGTSRSVRTKKQERERKRKNPWRSNYSRAEYKKACQVALNRTGGRCAVSGLRIADYKGGRWVMRPGGGIHHKVPLSQGGTNDPDNLVPLHVSVHNKIDAELRRKRKNA